MVHVHAQYSRSAKSMWGGNILQFMTPGPPCVYIDRKILAGRNRSKKLRAMLNTYVIPMQGMYHTNVLRNLNSVPLLKNHNEPVIECIHNSNLQLCTFLTNLQLESI